MVPPRPLTPILHRSNARGHKISINAEILQFVKTANNAPDECLVVFGIDQLLARARDAGGGYAGFE